MAKLGHAVELAGHLLGQAGLVVHVDGSWRRS